MENRLSFYGLSDEAKRAVMGLCVGHYVTNTDTDPAMEPEEVLRLLEEHAGAGLPDDIVPWEPFADSSADQLYNLIEGDAIHLVSILPQLQEIIRRDQGL